MLYTKWTLYCMLNCCLKRFVCVIGTVTWAEASSHPLGESAQNLHTSSDYTTALLFHRCRNRGPESSAHGCNRQALVVGVCFVLLFYYLPGCLACNVILSMQCPRRPEEDIRSPELELHAVVGHSMCAGNQPSGRAASVCIHWAISSAQAGVLTLESSLSTDTELYLKYKPEVTTGMCDGLGGLCPRAHVLDAGSLLWCARSWAPV